MSDRLSALLLAERVVPAAMVHAATARQRVYGGGLETALMELGALSEAAVWARLSAATGLPVPPPALTDGADVALPPALSPERTGPLRAVPLGSTGRRLRVVCAEPVAIDDIRQAAAERGFDVDLYIVPEPRLLALRQRVYGETLPQRYAPLLARAMGTLRARKSFPHPRWEQDATEALAAAPLAVAPDAPARATLATMLDSALTPLERVLGLAPSIDASGATDVEAVIRASHAAGEAVFSDSTGIPIDVELENVLESEPIEAEIARGRQPMSAREASAELLANSATEALCRRARSRDDKGRPLALRALRRRLDHPRTLVLLAELREEAAGLDAQLAREAIETLGELRDEGAIPIFIHCLKDGPDDVIDAAHEALAVLTGHAFEDVEQWGTWWLEHAWNPRTAWLLDALGDPEEGIRRRAFEELRPLSPDTFGYTPDLPSDERAAAHRRWIEWWRAHGGTGLPDPGALEPSEDWVRPPDA